MWPSPTRVEDWFARRFTLWRCARCGAEATGEDGEDGGQDWMQRHTEIQHPGRPALFTVYPPSMGLRPRGGDA